MLIGKSFNININYIKKVLDYYILLTNIGTLFSQAKYIIQNSLHRHYL